ncbi:hypothetical protein NET02_16105 [Thermomicrobiaceae bacterium CFH 74404]|uniref:Uncharacterized protein n=1 Tax=Thermalbibacter longus TaxID=2951981 RepID=A0AA41WEM6_9BACT|nr:hypothetical protein [Thermalbibacter longus]MCM8750667.1 hypothetical protein [Thermalbibacter longus]
MDVIEIRERMITLYLTPEDAFCLASALRVAKLKAGDANTSCWLTTTRSCLEAAALAAGAFSLCHPETAARLSLSALRAGRILDRVPLTFDVDILPRAEPVMDTAEEGEPA